VSLLLFVYNAEAMHTQFVGAMCATACSTQRLGLAALFLKIAAFFAAVWLTLNGWTTRLDYLVRLKYGSTCSASRAVWRGALVQPVL